MSLFKNELAVLRPVMPEKVEALFTLREGGVSSGPWGNIDGIMGLNVGSRVQDNAGCVRMNRDIVAQLTPQTPHWMTQVHGVSVVDAESVQDESVEADAQITTVPGVVCTVQVADCLPVLLADTEGRVVGAAHAGWRSLVGGILEATVKSMREAVQNEQAEIVAWLGPRIGFDDFETNAQTKVAFEQAYPEAESQGIKPSDKDDHWKLDLAYFAKLALARVGVRECIDENVSTVADPKRFYSYRRDGECTGRHAALIWLKPQD